MLIPLMPLLPLRLLYNSKYMNEDSASITRTKKNKKMTLINVSTFPSIKVELFCYFKIADSMTDKVENFPMLG